MNKQTISLGRIFGISIGLDWSWFLIFALLTWTLATAYFPFELALPAAGDWILGAVTAVLFFVSVLLHELGHSVVALRFKVPVRRITLFIFGGIAEITQEPPSARAEFLIAIAGPIVSFALAGIFGVIALGSTVLAPIFVVAKYLAVINGWLGLFNLVPGFPLDGGRLFRAIVWRATGKLSRATYLAANLGRVIAFLLMAFGIWQLFGGDPSGLWIAFIGWFLLNAAGAELEQLEVQELLSHHWVLEAMNPNYTIIPAESTLQQVVDQYLSNVAPRRFAVQQSGTTLGWLTWHDINMVPRTRWRTTTAQQAMQSLAQVQPVRPDTDLSVALKEMGQYQVDELPVVAGDRPVGTLSRKDILSFLRQHNWLRA
jgi:Zn-dependent protease